MYMCIDIRLIALDMLNANMGITFDPGECNKLTLLQFVHVRFIPVILNNEFVNLISGS